MNMKNFTIKSILFDKTKAGLTVCKDRISLITHSSEIKDSFEKWEIDAQGHGVAYMDITSIEELKKVLPYINEHFQTDFVMSVRYDESRRKTEKDKQYAFHYIFESKEAFENNNRLNSCQIFEDKNHVPTIGYKDAETDFVKWFAIFLYGFLYFKCNYTEYIINDLGKEN